MVEDAQETRKPNLSDIVDELVETTYHLLRWRIIASQNRVIEDEEKARELGLPENYFIFDHTELNKIVDLVKPMLKDAQSTRKIEAQTSLEVIQLLQRGEVSVEDAIKLMNLVKSKVEVEEKETKVKIQKNMYELLE
jgi:hypothetical protein